MLVLELDRPARALTFVSLNLRLKDLLGPVTRVKKKKKKKRWESAGSPVPNQGPAPNIIRANVFFFLNLATKKL